MIDEKGRLFGKVNVLDLVVVLVLLAGVSYLGYRYVRPEATAPAQTKTIEVTLLITPVRQPTIEELQVGKDVVETKAKVVLGTIVAVETRPAQRSGSDAEYVSGFTYDHFITIRGNGSVAPGAPTLLSGVEMWKGSSYGLAVGDWKGGAVVWGINKEPAPVTK